MSNMSAYDSEVPKLDSTPPESEEVTRVGTRDEIARALETGSAPSTNNIPTPPVPAPDAEMRASLGAVPGARLAPPPADLVEQRANDMPTKPPVTGVVTESDIEDAFRDTSLEDGELDSELLEPAPASVRTEAMAPPLPPRANVTAPLRLTPAEAAKLADIPPAPRAPSVGTGTLRMQAQPKPVVPPMTDAGEGESGARLKRAPRVDASPGSGSFAEPAPIVSTPGGAFVPAPAPEPVRGGEPIIKRNPALSALVILGVLAFLVGLFLLRR